MSAHRNKIVPEMIFVYNNNDHIIHQKTTLNAKHKLRHKGKIDYHPTFIHIIDTEMNQLIRMVIFLVVYQQDPQMMYQNLLNCLHVNIILETDLFLLVIVVIETKIGFNASTNIQSYHKENETKNQNNGNQKSSPKEVFFNENSTTDTTN